MAASQHNAELACEKGNVCPRTYAAQLVADMACCVLVMMSCIVKVGLAGVVGLLEL